MISWLLKPPASDSNPQSAERQENPMVRKLSTQNPLSEITSHINRENREESHAASGIHNAHADTSPMWFPALKMFVYPIENMSMAPDWGSCGLAHSSTAVLAKVSRAGQAHIRACRPGALGADTGKHLMPLIIPVKEFPQVDHQQSLMFI